MSCIVCSKPKHRNNKKYCSKVCYNADNPKKGQCFKCKIIISACYKYCEECRFSPDFKVLTKFPKETTLEEVTQKTTYHRNSLICYQARQLYLQNNPKTKCSLCGYSIYIQVCHIKPIRSFHSKATLEEINHQSNLIGLCPTHHWEMDHNLLCDDDKVKLKEIINGKI